MVLTALLLILKLTTVFVEPGDPLEKNDQTLATCAVEALTARPSDLPIAKSKDHSDATPTVGFHPSTWKQPGAYGNLTDKTGTVLVELKHSPLGIFTMCGYMDGLLDKMTKELAAKQHVIKEK